MLEQNNLSDNSESVSELKNTLIEDKINNKKFNVSSSINFLDEISDFIFISKYARYNEEKKRRETLSEAVDRVSQMHLQKYDYLNEEDKNKIKWAFDLVKQKKVVPSMRSLQFGGQAVFAHHPRIYNCLAKETEFITSKGIKKFEDFKDGDIITVLTDKGNWKKAVVKNFGVQELHPIVVKRVKSEKTIWSTKNHDWILKDGTRTTELKEGMILKGSEDIFSSFSYQEATVEQKLYWCYGYVYGDGTKVKNSKGEYAYSMVRLCGDKNIYLDRFLEMGFNHSNPPIANGDAVVYTGHYLKDAPNPDNTSIDNLKAFVRGYLDADGKKDKNSTTREFSDIQSSQEDHIDFIRKVFPIVGQYIISEEELTGEVTNFGVRPYTVSFRLNSSLNNKINSNTPFVVKSIGQDVRVEEVWCLQVEDDHSFVLPFGLTTGNCGTRHIDSLRSFSEFFYCLLTGTGMTAGVSKKIISRLPNLVTDRDKTGTILTYTIQDDIEGWADSIEALLMCYHKNTPFTGRKIVYDYSKIRKKGSPLKTGGGKAPGHAGLKQAHIKIKALLDHIIEDLKLEQLRSIDIYDILMHCADAVLSGGIRRAATAVIFDPDDNLMMEAKTNFKISSYKRFEKMESGFWEGTVVVNNKKYEVTLSDWEYNESLIKNKEIGWYHIEPQRARSNNSVLLLRNNTTKEQLEDIINKTKQWGEPGFVFADDPLTLFNPCITADTLIETNKGNIKASELVERLKTEEDIFALSMNTETKEVQMQQILYGEMTNDSAEIYEIELEDGSIRKFSKGHLIYTENRGYVKIEELTDEDEVIVSC